MPQNLVLGQESYAVVGACFEVYNRMGCGFLETVYQECLSIEFSERAIPFEAQAELPLFFRGRKLASRFKADFVCHSAIVIEIKAVSGLVDEHRSQLLNYLHASGCPLGMLIIFGHHPGLEFERLVLSHPGHPPVLSRLTDSESFRRTDWKPHSRPFA
jgi:GxxExxY protein